MQSKDPSKNTCVTEDCSVLNKDLFLTIFAMVIFLRVYVKVHLILLLSFAKMSTKDMHATTSIEKFKSPYLTA